MQDVSFEKISIQSGVYQLSGNFLKTDSVAPEKRHGVLILHGGGSVTKERFSSLQNALQRQDFCSLAIDFRGVGESEGDLGISSLQTRLEDATAALHWFLGYSQCISVLGSSMGGHVAMRLTKNNPSLCSLLLLGAAVYAETAEPLPFFQQFTEEIRKPLNWQNSLAFIDLKNFSKPVFAMYGEFDTIIPLLIQEKIKLLVQEKGHFYIMPGAGHQLLREETINAIKIRDAVLQSITDFLLEVRGK